MQAAALDHAEAVRLLLEAGADPERREATYRYTALMIAALLSHLDSVAALAEGGAEIDVGDPRTGATPLILAASSRDRAAPLTVAELLVRGAGIDLPRKDGLKPRSEEHTSELQS